MLTCILKMSTVGSYVAWLAGNVVLGSFTLFLTFCIGIRFLVKPDTTREDTAAKGDNTEMQANTPEASQTDAAAAAAETVQKEEVPAEVIDTNSVEANMPEVEKTIKALLDGGSLSKYCTKACIKKMKKAALDEFGGDEEAAGEPSVIDLFPCDYTDGFGGSKMIKSIKAEKGNAVVVSYKVFDKTFKTNL